MRRPKNLAEASFSGQNLKTIEKEGFYALTSDGETGVASGESLLLLPDTVESIGERAFASGSESHTAVQALPASLRNWARKRFPGTALKRAHFRRGWKKFRNRPLPEPGSGRGTERCSFRRGCGP